MSTLSDRLKSMGVKLGRRDLAPSRPRQDYSIEAVLPGRHIETHIGSAYVVESIYPQDYLHGNVILQFNTSLQRIAEWAGEPQVSQLNSQAFAFLDTETSGLSGGTGTYAFMVGIGRFEERGFHLAQFFMRDPLEEPAHLLAVEEFLAACESLVTFNGKSFDVPLLNTRFTLHGWRTPLSSIAQVDMLHLARRLWREILPSRTLGTLEYEILGASRTEEEVPGWMIPQMYFDYLRSGDARPMRSVFYHNAMDVLSLAALLNHVARLLEDPFQHASSQQALQLAIGRLFEDLGHLDKAVQIYTQCIASAEIPVRLDALYRLSFLNKRRGDYASALPLWKQAAAHGQVYALIELAKVYEHLLHDYPEAIHWTQSALILINSADISQPERIDWSADLEHRLARLKNKLTSQKGGLKDLA